MEINYNAEVDRIYRKVLFLETIFGYNFEGILADVYRRHSLAELQKISHSDNSEWGTPE